MPINNNKNANKCCAPNVQKNIPRKGEMSKPQGGLYIIHIIITNQREERHRERYCPLLVKPTVNNLLIQQQKQMVTQDHHHKEGDEIMLKLNVIKTDTGKDCKA